MERPEFSNKPVIYFLSAETPSKQSRQCPADLITPEPQTCSSMNISTQTLRLAALWHGFSITNVAVVCR